MRSRAMVLEADTEHYIFKGTRQSKCMGSQLKAFQCPVVEDCAPACVQRDCHFAEWSDWNDPTCVGLCERQRVIAETNNECGKPCNGTLLETKRCPVTCNDPKDCILTDWEEWSKCPSKDVGQRYRLRKIAQEPMNGGDPSGGISKRHGDATRWIRSLARSTSGMNGAIAALPAAKVPSCESGTS
jgi:hypothetical protein